MGDLGDYYRDVKEASREHREQNYTRILNYLQERGLAYTEFANGHLRVGDYDVWATTGSYLHRPSGKRGKGVNKFLALISHQ